MEYLKSCNTNAQSIGGYDAVSYQAFSVKHPPGLTRSNERSPSEDIRSVETELRQLQHLVVQDATRPWLWLFRAVALEKATEKPNNLPQLDGFHLQLEQFGVMKASDLARPALRSANPNTPSSAGTSSPLTTNAVRGSLAGAGNQQQSSDSLILYELFTASIVALVSYHLVKDHNTVALNYRTFLTKSTPTEDDCGGEDAHTAREASIYLSNVSVYWASNGTLLVSSFSVAHPAIHCLDEMSSIDLSKQVIGKCVRIAPSGALAKLVSFDDPLDRSVEDADRLPPKKRARPGPAAQSIEKWKLAVARWLSSKGYLTSGLDKPTAWARIHVPQLNRYASNQSRDMLWPRSLCFYYDDVEQRDYNSSLSNSAAGPFEWFATSHSSGFVDPFDTAQQWFFGQAERDKALEVRRQALKAEEEAAKSKEEIPGALFPSSPLNLRNNAYGDHQAASGVYPTPPDGIAPGTAVSHGDTPSISGTVANTILAPGGMNPGINLSGPQENPSSDAAHPSATSPDFSMDFENFNSSAGNDPFDDMDEDDDFGANGVTDADFNFFNEPDGGEVEMIDAPVVQENGHFSPVPVDEVDHTAQAVKTDEKRIGDSVVAPENSLPIDPEPHVNQVQDTSSIPNGKTSNEIGSADPGRYSPTSTKPSSSIAIKREPVTTPLARIQEAVKATPTSLSRLKRNTPHRDSIFNPVDFDEKMKLSDEKYYKGRFNFPQEKVQAKPASVASPAKLTASLKNVPLLARMRYAVGIATKPGLGQVQPIVHDDDDSESTSSLSSSLSEDDDDIVSLPPEPLSAGMTTRSKRKLPTDGNGTPLSVTSFADSLGGDALELACFHLDEGSLSLLDPSPWDWSLIDMPPPVEVKATTGRYSIPSFSPMVSSLPSTPTSQPEFAFETPEEKPPNKNDTIFVAQVVTDQIVSATLDIFHEDPPSLVDLAPRIPKTEVQRTVKSIFPRAVECNVSGLISIADVYPEVSTNVKGAQRAAPRRPNEGPVLPGSHIIPLQPPMVRTRRADQLWEFLPPALAFWEALGLAPCGAPKNVASICIYPHSESLKPCVRHFLINLRIAYEGCKLGNHDRAEVQPDYPDGLVPWVPTQPKSARAAFISLRDTCVVLGKALATKHAQMRDNDDAPSIDSFVVYMINPFKDSPAIWELCSAFWCLFQAYGQGPSARANAASKPDVVLQIVPIEAIASFDVPVILNASTYANLAREVYDRCPPSGPGDDKSPLSIYSAPSFQLEEAIPRRIDFKLIADPPQDMLRENSYIHVGYAISLDGSWVTCAWADSPGKSRTVISYHLGTRAFREVAKEIWQTTIDVCQARKVTWRLCIAKCGAMDREELEVWHYFSTLHTPVNFFITLLTVNSNPPLKFTPTTPTTAAANNPQPSANTPASTPKAGVSPDQHSLTPAPTPAADSAADPSNDPDTRLVDVTDETWGVILAHRLHNTNSTVEFRPCLISGLLVKRGQSQQATTPAPSIPDPEQGPIVVGVNILWISTMSPRAATSPFPTAADGTSPGGQVLSPSPTTERDRMSLMWTPTPQHRSTAESVLREVLVQFRNLGTLARLKGIRGCRMGTVPWHVAVAKRGVERLTKCFPSS